MRTGYRKVTVDEVAARARVGKGTVYLYWPSKVELFGTVLTREAAWLTGRQPAAIQADPHACRLHRTGRASYVDTMSRPLSKAVHTRDEFVLGELLTGSAAGRRFGAGKVETTARYLAVLYEHGLLADGPAADPALAEVATGLPVLVIGEGLLQYLDEAAAYAFFNRVTGAFPGGAFVFDAYGRFTARVIGLASRFSRFPVDLSMSVDDPHVLEAEVAGLTLTDAVPHDEPDAPVPELDAVPARPVLTC